MKKYLPFIALFFMGYQSAAQWIDQSYLGNNTSNSLLDVEYLSRTTSPDTAVAVGDSGIVLKTTDGGATWTMKVTSKTYEYVIFNDVVFADASTGYICGTDSTFDGIILKTTDGGDTWNLLTSATAADTGYTGIDFINPSTGWVCGGFGLIRKTTDGGATWTKMSTPTGRMLNDIYFVDNNIGFSINSDRKVLRTTDGITWNMLNTGGNDTTLTSSIRFLNADTGWIAHRDSILMSVDTGKTWTTLFTTGNNKTLTWVNIASDGKGLAVGDVAGYYTTDDYGLNWTADNITNYIPSITYPLFGADLRNENEGFVVGRYGTLVKLCRAPVAGFNAAPLTAHVNTGISFTNTTVNGLTYEWNFGDGSPLETTVNASHAYAQADNYLVRLIARNNSTCEDTSYKQVLITAGISGNVFLSDLVTPVTDGKVFLFRRLPSVSKMERADSLDLDFSGTFNFPDNVKGQYLLFAVPDTNIGAFQNTLPTFYKNTFFWHKANMIPLLTDTSGVDIEIVDRPAPLPKGPGKISGRVIEADTTQKMGPGDPLEGVDISLVNQGSGSVVATTQTTTGGPVLGGFYSFNDLSTGSYQLFMNVPGVGMDTLHTLTIDSANPIIDNVIVEVDTNFIYIEIDSGTLVRGAGSITGAPRVFPNPVNEMLHVVIPSAAEISISLKIFGLPGDLVYAGDNLKAGKNNRFVAVDVSEFHPGMYILEVNCHGKPELSGISRFVVIRK